MPFFIDNEIHPNLTKVFVFGTSTRLKITEKFMFDQIAFETETLL